MTGMGSDGLSGAGMVREAGGYVAAQSRESCVVYGMPKAVIEAGLANEVVHLQDIPDCILRVATCRRSIGASDRAAPYQGERK